MIQIKDATPRFRPDSPQSGPSMNSKPPPADHTVELPVRTHRIEGQIGPGDDLLMVLCPLDRQARLLEHCSQCPRYQALCLSDEGATLECCVPFEVAPPTEATQLDQTR